MVYYTPFDLSLSNTSYQWFQSSKDIFIDKIWLPWDFYQGLPVKVVTKAWGSQGTPHHPPFNGPVTLACAVCHSQAATRERYRLCTAAVSCRLENGSKTHFRDVFPQLQGNVANQRLRSGCHGFITWLWPCYITTIMPIFMILFRSGNFIFNVITNKICIYKTNMAPLVIFLDLCHWSWHMLKPLLSSCHPQCARQDERKCLTHQPIDTWGNKPRAFEESSSGARRKAWMMSEINKLDHKFGSLKHKVLFLVEQCCGHTNAIPPSLLASHQDVSVATHGQQKHTKCKASSRADDPVRGQGAIQGEAHPHASVSLALGWARNHYEVLWSLQFHCNCFRSSCPTGEAHTSEHDENSVDFTDYVAMEVEIGEIVWPHKTSNR